MNLMPASRRRERTLHSQRGSRIPDESPRHRCAWQRRGSCRLQVRLAGLCRADVVVRRRLYGRAAPAIHIGIYRDRLDPHFAAGANDAHGDFSAIGDQDTFEHKKSRGLGMVARRRPVVSHLRTELRQIKRTSQEEAPGAKHDYFFWSINTAPACLFGFLLFGGHGLVYPFVGRLEVGPRPSSQSSCIRAFRDKAGSCKPLRRRNQDESESLVEISMPSSTWLRSCFRRFADLFVLERLFGFNPAWRVLPCAADTLGPSITPTE